MRVQQLKKLCAVAILATAAAQAETVFESGERQVGLVELYTSEGCSSCPPADRWLGGLADDAGLWVDFVPVGFHVDYWDYIGWKDRYSRPAYSARQRELAAEGGARTVYTPGVFIDGTARLGWRGSTSFTAGHGNTGTLTVRVDGQDVAIRFDAVDGNVIEPVVHLALLGMGLSSEVKAGENRGRTLHHDFVVLGLSSAPLSGGTGGYTGIAKLPATGFAADRYALAAWVSANGDAAPIQAAGGYLPPRR
jgi:hypothetical protein